MTFSNGLQIGRTTVPLDFKKAFDYYIQATDQGFSHAYFYLGDSYLNGEGVEQDFAKAKAMYEKAEANNVVRASLKLGLMYNRQLVGERKLR